MNVDADGLPIDFSPLEARVPGVHPDLITGLAVQNLIMFPSMVVKRRTYEQLGGFHPSLFHSADWDMWKRVAVDVPVWYEPAALAMYRIHSQSDTSSLMRTGANIADARHAGSRSPAHTCRRGMRPADEAALHHHGLYAIELAGQMVDRRAWSAARAQLREAFRCSTTLPVARSVCVSRWTRRWRPCSPPVRASPERPPRFLFADRS